MGRAEEKSEKKRATGNLGTGGTGTGGNRENNAKRHLLKIILTRKHDRFCNRQNRGEEKTMGGKIPNGPFSNFSIKNN